MKCIMKCKDMNRILKKDKNRQKGCRSLVTVASILVLFYMMQVVSADQILVDTNRPVVLDDPTTGTAGAGFSNPSRSWGTDYWNGESTTIRAIALVLDNNGTPKSGVTVNFVLKNPAGTTKNSASSITNSKGLAYYSNDTNNQRYWGYWRIDATISGTTNSSSFILNWWACSSCHSSENPGTWNTYTPKSYYAKGYNFHKGSTRNQHTQQMSSGNCVACHQSYDKASDWHSGKLVCANCHAGSNLSTTPQGKNPEIAGCYDTTGCHTKKNTNLTKVNSTTGYIINGNYKTKYSAIPTNSTKAHTVSDTVECIVCHSAGHNITKPYNALSSSNDFTENDQCWTCHTNRATTHKSNSNCVSCHTPDAHNISIAGGGGPGCISCHNVIGGSAAHKVDVSAISLGEHSNLNSGAASTVDPANKKCWGCHQTGGTQPTDMGDRYTNPYKCYDCHGATKPYANVGSALTVDEHFKSGTDIQAAISAADNSSSCLACHNLAEMKVSYTDNEFTNYSLASHYGKNRSDIRISGITDCKYCHQNGSTIFVSAMSNSNNKNMSNHSSSINTPTCTNTNCHNTGKVHDSSLSKPVDSSDTYCKTCHIGKEEHKTLYCTECHANIPDGSKAGRDIHGIKYLQKDNTFSQVKSGSVDCTTCHQSNVVDSSLGTFTPVKIGVLHHSNNLTNGSRWGSYWASSIEACLYCHNDTKHDSTPLGRPLIWNPSYVMNATIGSGTNCADCHYGGDSNYANMNLAFTGDGIPPEITSGSWNGKPGYYNHTLGDYTDLTCKSCHGTGTTTVGEMVHNVSEGGGGAGGGGADCKLCHDVGGLAPKLVSFSIMNQNNASHKNLNNGASSTVNAENKKCWACHGDGSQPGSHPSNYKSPLACVNCHTGTGSFNGPIVTEHTQIGQDVVTAVNCTQCHTNPGMGLGGSESVQQAIHYIKYVTNMLITPYGHNGTMNTANCIECHNGPYTGAQIWGTPVNISTSTNRQHTETTTVQCDSCHKDGSMPTLADVDFHNAAVRLGAGQGPNCLDCHSSAR